MIFGATEWFAPGDYARVERVLDHLRTMGLGHLRAGIHLDDTTHPEHEAWFDWLVPRIAREVDVVPCLVAAPPANGNGTHEREAPRSADDIADLFDAFVQRHGAHFSWIEVWNEPNDLVNWDHRSDPDGQAFAHMLDVTAKRMHARGKKVLLGGMHPIDPHWLDALFRHGAMTHVHAVGLHAFPANDTRWGGWQRELEGIQDVFARHDSGAELWLSAVGQATHRHDHMEQVQLAQDVLELDVPRVYWARVEDVDPDAATRVVAEPHTVDMGLYRSDARPRLLAQLLADDRDLSTFRWMAQEHALAAGPEHIVITGGAGFVGTNLAHRLLNDGQQVLIYDDLSRPGSLDNLEWLHATHGNALRVRVADVRDQAALRRAIHGARAVFHLAAQTAVTTSLQHVRADFEINAEGTLNVLEAVRGTAPDAFVLYASTNKVYGSLERTSTDRGGARSRRLRGRRHDGPDRPVSFATPYGCSKGSADQYVLDYARTLGLHATAFRMSCIYGPHQNGTADQGWVSHFLRSAREGRTITIYGDGHQVRDVLHVDDLVDAYLLAMSAPGAVEGHAWDIGGGPRNAISLLDLLDIMTDVGCPRPTVEHDAERPSDQRHYVSDIAPLRQALNWSPRINAHDGIGRLWQEPRPDARLEVTA